MNVQHLLYDKIKDGSFALFTAEEIARKLHLGGKQQYALRDMLQSLVREGKLLRDSRFRYGTPEQFGATVGTVVGNERGFAFVIPEDGSEDLFIPHRAINGALHGDTVYALRTRGGRSGDEGEILAVVKRGYTQIVGIFRRKNKQCGYLYPDERKYNECIYIPTAQSKNCPDGAKAVAKITSFPDGRSPGGEIIEILGDGDDFFVEELSLIRAHHLREQFPDEVTLAAEQRAALPLSQEELQGREDLRNTLIITVDGEDTRDIDDAISIEKKDGKYYLGVHIADVTHYVPRNGVVDKEAFQRGTSVYFPDRVLPMLPKALSNGICSLNEGVDRLALSCFMTVDKQGKVLSKRVAPTIIKSAHRMTYTQITQIDKGEEEVCAQYPDLVPFVKTAIELTNILKRARNERGGVTMDVKEAKILYVNDEIIIPDHARDISHEMIEQFMVLANESVATLMTEQKLPFIYRIHEQPAAEKAQALKTFLKEAGYNLPLNAENVTPRDYQAVLQALEGEPIYPIANRVMLRSMMKAQYSPENVGHFGLASDCYCHFTSPIRRYPDLCIHRIIKLALTQPEEAKKAFEHFVGIAAKQSSECERNATEAERDVDALYITAYMQDKIGETYQATVSGVTSFGVFAELDNTVEGLIPIDLLPDDYYEYVEEKFLLRGTKHSFRLGERLLIKVVGVDWGARRAQFQLISKLSPDKRQK